MKPPARTPASFPTVSSFISAGSRTCSILADGLGSTPNMVTWSDADVGRQSLGGEEKLWDVGGPQQPGGQDQHLQRGTVVEKSDFL